MRAVVSKYYRKWVPYRIRHKIRECVYYMVYMLRHDKFVDVNSTAFKQKSEELYCENVTLFYVSPQTIQNAIVVPKTSEPICESWSSKIYKFRKVSCFGASDIIKLDRYHYFYEIRDYYRQARRVDVSTRDTAPLIVDENDYYVFHHYSKSFIHIDKGILLSSYWASNYYHFTFQCLAKLRLCGNIDKRVPLLVNDAVAKYSSFQQLLQICNVNEREIILLAKDKQYDIDELYYISPQIISAPSYKRGVILSKDNMYLKESLTYLRKMMLPYIDKEYQVPEKVFLARRYASDRRGYNEEECFRALKPYGFTEVRPETLNIGQQIALFNKAKCIVGATGAAFTNLIYGNAKCKYIILKATKSEESIFSTLATFNGAQLVYLCSSICSQEIDASHIHDSFKIDINELKKCIETLYVFS